MFAGHAAIALAARPTLPRQSLGVLFAATYLIDLIWPVLLLAGIERVEIDPGNTAFTPLNFVHYPWTHSLLMAILWGGVFAIAMRRDNQLPLRDTLWLVILVISHWFLDLVTHRPDLPLVPGGPLRIGFGLWNSIPGTLLVEGALYAAGVVIYLQRTRTRGGQRSLALWSLLGLIAIIWVAGPFSAPPPSAQAIAIVGLMTWLLPLWAHWADRGRELRSTTTAGSP